MAAARLCGRPPLSPRLPLDDHLLPAGVRGGAADADVWRVGGPAMQRRDVRAGRRALAVATQTTVLVRAAAGARPAILIFLTAALAEWLIL